MKAAQISPQSHVPPSGGCISNQAVIFTGVGFIISAFTIYSRHNTIAANKLFFTPDISGFFKKGKKKPTLNVNINSSHLQHPNE